jgi:hypothetical protein
LVVSPASATQEEIFQKNASDVVGLLGAIKGQGRMKLGKQQYVVKYKNYAADHTPALDTTHGIVVNYLMGLLFPNGENTPPVLGASNWNAHLSAIQSEVDGGFQLSCVRRTTPNVRLRDYDAIKNASAAVKRLVGQKQVEDQAGPCPSHPGG